MFCRLNQRRVRNKVKMRNSLFAEPRRPAHFSVSQASTHMKCEETDGSSREGTVRVSRYKGMPVADILLFYAVYSDTILMGVSRTEQAER